MTNHPTLTKPVQFPVGRPLTEDDARLLLSVRAYAEGGGWFTLGGTEETRCAEAMIYICRGTHRDGLTGWRVLEVR
jgi:hypothetical protein